MSVLYAERKPSSAVLDKESPAPMDCESMLGVATGTLIGFDTDAHRPLVTYPGQPGTAALVARAVVDLHTGHVGKDVVLIFDGGDPRSPIVMGWVRPSEDWPVADKSSPVSIDVDGHRLVVAAENQVVLRCGKASITLTKAGKVLIEGTFVLSRSSGVNRIKGGSVQIN